MRFLLCLVLVACHAAATPPPPRPVVRAYTWLDGGKPVGRGALTTDGARVTAVYRIAAEPEHRIAVTLDAARLPVRYAAGEEAFERAGEVATWRDPFAPGHARWAAPAYFVPYTDDPFTPSRIAAAVLTAPAHRVALVPAGEATLEELARTTVDGREVTAYAVLGLDLDPIAVWLDGDGALFAQLDQDGAGPIAAGHEAAAGALHRRAVEALAARAARLAAATIRRGPGFAIRHARLFDPISRAITEDATIVIAGDRIAAVGPGLATPAGVEALDARGRFVMPGLWDSHAHLFERSTAILMLAAGITTVRDMGNERDLPALVRDFDAGRALGPRVIMTVRVGRFPDADAPGVPQISSADDARRVVETYAARGYAQVKVLDGIDARWPPVLAELAHARGLRFSGHLPAGMTPMAFFAAGADELQHVPFLLRGVDPPAITDRVEAAIADMAARHVTLDPTLAQFEPGPASIAFEPTAALAAPRLPPLALRTLQRDIPDAALHARQVARFPVLGELVRRAHAAGVTIVPGADGAVAGFGLRRELAVYGALGLPPAEVLRMATYGAARNMHREARSGSIAPGKDADLIVIDGDPTRDLADLARVELVIKGGARLDPRALERLVSLAPAR